MADGKFVQQLATASSTERPANEAIDGDADTRWCAESGSMPQWWQIDLGATQTVAGIAIKWEFGDGHYRFKLDMGPDESHLATVLDRTQGNGDGDGEGKFDLPTGTAGRIVRITVTGATDAGGAAKWASIREATVMVMRDGKQVAWTPAASSRAATVPHADEFASTSFDDMDWHDLPVPSNWEVLGYSQPTYNRT